MAAYNVEGRQGVILLGRDEAKLEADQVLELRSLVAQDGPELEIVLTSERHVIEEHLARIVIAAGPMPRELLFEMPRLAWYQQWGAGADWMLRYPQVADARFAITSASGVHPQQMAEHVFAMLLGVARALPQALAAQRQNRWSRPDPRELFELAGKTMVILGAGSIGGRVAEIAKAFGMRTVGLRRSWPKEPPLQFDVAARAADLAEWLPEADVLTSCLPYSEETENLLGRPQLALLKRGAVLVNVGRGRVIDEAALIDELDTGRVRAALLDVFAAEPLPEDSPLWQRDDVMITAHYAGMSPHYDRRAMRLFMGNLRRFLRGEPLENVVHAGG